MAAEIVRESSPYCLLCPRGVQFSRVHISRHFEMRKKLTGMALAKFEAKRDVW